MTILVVTMSSGVLFEGSVWVRGSWIQHGVNSTGFGWRDQKKPDFFCVQMFSGNIDNMKCNWTFCTSILPSAVSVTFVLGADVTFHDWPACRTQTRRVVEVFSCAHIIIMISRLEGRINLKRWWTWMIHFQQNMPVLPSLISMPYNTRSCINPAVDKVHFDKSQDAGHIKVKVTDHKAN